MQVSHGHFCVVVMKAVQNGLAAETSVKLPPRWMDQGVALPVGANVSRMVASQCWAGRAPVMVSV